MKTKNTKRVTLDLLQKLKACRSGVEYWGALPKEHRHDPLWLMQHAIDSDDKEIMRDANWLITRLLSTKNAQRYAVFAARQVLPLFDEKYPDDDRPRKAIEAAEAVIKRNTAENREKAKLAADAAWGAVADAAAAWAVAWAAVAAPAAAAWADKTARAAADAADADAGKQMIIKILKYGMDLLG